jgi:hypothetical protein
MLLARGADANPEKRPSSRRGLLYESCAKSLLFARSRFRSTWVGTLNATGYGSEGCFGFLRPEVLIPTYLCGVP